MTAPAEVVVDTDVLDWMVHATCRGAEPEQFFPELKGNCSLRGPSETAWRYCQPCPVLQLCHDRAERNQDVGLWGGSLRRQRFAGSAETDRIPLVPRAPKRDTTS